MTDEARCLTPDVGSAKTGRLRLSISARCEPALAPATITVGLVRSNLKVFSSGVSSAMTFSSAAQISSSMSAAFGVTEDSGSMNCKFS